MPSILLNLFARSTICLRGGISVRAGMAGFLLFALSGTFFANAYADADQTDTSAHADHRKNRHRDVHVPGTVHAANTSIDLAFWKITLPVNAQGVESGDHDAVEVYDLAGIAIPPWFDVGPQSLTFTVPVDGAKTKGTKYPRSELREMDGADQEYDWVLADGGHLSATLRVDELPDTGWSPPPADSARDTQKHDPDARTDSNVSSEQDPQVAQTDDPQGKKQDHARQARVVIGQIHGPDDELCRLYYSADGTVFFVDDKAGKDEKETKFKLVSAQGHEPRIPMGNAFAYTIDANSERLEVTVTYDGVKYTGIDPISAFWPGKALYFKAGAYLQVTHPGSKAGTIGTGRGQVTFLALSHAQHAVRHPTGE